MVGGNDVGYNIPGKYNHFIFGSKVAKSFSEYVKRI